MYNTQLNETTIKFLKDLQKDFTDLQHLNPFEFAKKFINLEEYQKIQAKQQEEIKSFIEQFSKGNIDFPKQIIDYSNQFTAEFKEKLEQSAEMNKQILEKITLPEYKEQLEQIFKVNQKLSDINQEMVKTTQDYVSHIMNLNKEGLAILQAFNPMFFGTTSKPKNKSK